VFTPKFDFALQYNLGDEILILIPQHLKYLCNCIHALLKKMHNLVFFSSKGHSYRSIKTIIFETYKITINQVFKSNAYSN